MTACFVGETHGEVVDRVGAFLAVRGGEVDPEALSTSAATAGSPAPSRRSPRGCGARALGVTRVFLQHLNHSDDEMIGLAILPSVASGP